MQNAALMRIMDRSRDRHEQLDCLLWLKSPLRQSLSKRATVDQRHAEKEESVVFASFVDRNDVRVIQFSGRFGLRPEPLDIDGAGESPGEDHLHSDDSIQTD